MDKIIFDIERPEPQITFEHGPRTWMWCPHCMDRTDHIELHGSRVCLHHNKITLDGRIVGVIPDNYPSFQ
jgi:hypothetical protein